MSSKFPPRNLVCQKLSTHDAQVVLWLEDRWNKPPLLPEAACAYVGGIASKPNTYQVWQNRAETLAALPRPGKAQA